MNNDAANIANASMSKAEADKNLYPDGKTNSNLGQNDDMNVEAIANFHYV